MVYKPGDEEIIRRETKFLESLNRNGLGATLVARQTETRIRQAQERIDREAARTLSNPWEPTPFTVSVGGEQIAENLAPLPPKKRGFTFSFSSEMLASMSIPTSVTEEFTARMAGLTSAISAGMIDTALAVEALDHMSKVLDEQKENDMAKAPIQREVFESPTWKREGTESYFEEARAAGFLGVDPITGEAYRVVKPEEPEDEDPASMFDEEAPVNDGLPQYVTVRAYLSHVDEMTDGAKGPWMFMNYQLAPHLVGGVKVGDVVLCPPTPGTNGAFPARVVDTNQASVLARYSGQVKTITLFHRRIDSPKRLAMEAAEREVFGIEPWTTSPLPEPEPEPEPDFDW